MKVSKGIKRARRLKAGAGAGIGERSRRTRTGTGIENQEPRKRPDNIT